MSEALDNGELAVTPSVEFAFAIEEAMHECNLMAIRRQSAGAPLIDVIRCEAFFDLPMYVAFLVVPDQPVNVRVVGECSLIDAQVERFLDGLQCRDTRQAYSLLHRVIPNAGAELHALLLDPWRDRLAPYEHLVWCLDGALSRVPLECLQDEFGKPLLERHSCSYLSASQRFAFSGIIDHSHSCQSEPLVVGDPQFDKMPGAAFACDPLPGARNEAQMVADLLGTSAYVGAAAGKRRLLDAHGSAIVHIASHGYAIPSPEGTEARPLLSAGLLFAGANSLDFECSAAGILSAEEAIATDMGSTVLAVLSACHTAAGTRGELDNLAGLAYAFEAAGTQSLVAGLWRVPDEPTRILMEAFYARLRDGRNIAQALRDAKLAVRERYSTFGAWGAFILIGRWEPVNLLARTQT